MKQISNEQYNIIKKELKCFTIDYLVELLMNHGDISKTVDKVVKDFAYEGSIYHTFKKIKDENTNRQKGN